jgi:hypothetical protein
MRAYQEHSLLSIALSSVIRARLACHFARANLSENFAVEKNPTAFRLFPLFESTYASIKWNQKEGKNL